MINAEDAGIEVLDIITDGKVTVDAISAMVLVKGETVDTDSVYLDNYREPSVDDEDDTTGNGGSGDVSTPEKPPVVTPEKPPVVTPEAPVVTPERPVVTPDAPAEESETENAPTVVTPQAQQTTTSDNEEEIAPEEDVLIEEEETPLASGSEEESEVEIPEEEVPLATEADSVNVVPVIVMLIALTALVYVGVLLVKKGTIKFPK